MQLMHLPLPRVLLLSDRMPVVSRLDFFWAAVELLWRWPVMPAIRVCPRVQQERSHSSKVSMKVIYQQMPTMDDTFLRGGGAGCSESRWFNVIYISLWVIWPSYVFLVHYFSFWSHSVAGWPKLLWFVTESKHLSKPPRDWFPHIKDANNDTAYIEVSCFLSNRVVFVITQSLICLSVCVSVSVQNL